MPDLASAPATAPEPALARGTALGRFVVLGLVGRGAMGEVYGAYDPELDRKIALKLVRARADRGGDTADGRTRLMREAQATAKVSHPNVVVVYDAGTFGERVFIAMEFVDGHTLRYWLLARERPWHEILEAFLAAGRGLAAAHEKELVHRDFKPDNVMVSNAGQVRVMDFGLARIAAGSAPAAAASAFDSGVELTGVALDLTATQPVGDAPDGSPSPLAFRDKITVTGAVLGTPAYMSPEQFSSQVADARSDQFSFCVALFEALYGVRPFAGRTIGELAENVVAGRLVPPVGARHVPASLRHALERGLRADPAARFPSMQALLVELEKRPGATRVGFESGAAAKLAGIWEAPVGGRSVETRSKDKMRDAFLATGKAYAADAFAGASATLDRYALRWTEYYVEICEATHVRGEQSADVLDLRMACLGEALDDLRALCDLFRAATPEVVQNAVYAANALVALERCEDVKMLRAVVRPPDDAQTRASVEQLHARLVEVRALLRVGRLAEGLVVGGPLVEEARRVGYGPALAEILLVYGTLQHHGAELQAVIRTLEDAVWTAEAARHDEIAAAAASHLVFMTGYQEGRFDMGELWCRHTEAVLRRMGAGHDQIWGWYYNNRSTMREQQGRLADAIADAKLAIEFKQRAQGPESPDLALSLNNLANHLAFACDFSGALEAGERANAMVVAAHGPEHPQTAQSLINLGQFLYRVGRYEDARVAASRALAIFEREAGSHGIWVTFPLRTLGLAHLALGHFTEALAALERAVAIREALQVRPLRLAELHFPLARAVEATGGDPARALALARRARQEYEQVAKMPLIELDLGELDRWLAARG